MSRGILGPGGYTGCSGDSEDPIPDTTNRAGKQFCCSAIAAARIPWQMLGLLCVTVPFLVYSLRRRLSLRGSFSGKKENSSFQEDSPWSHNANTNMTDVCQCNIALIPISASIVPV